MSSFVYLYSIAFLIFLGLVLHQLSARFNIPYSVPLILSGFLVSRFIIKNGFITIPRILFESIILLSIVIIVFDIFSRFRFDHPTSMHAAVFSFKIIFFFFAIPIITASMYYLFNFNSIVYPLLFSVLVLSSSRSYIKKFKHSRHKITHILEIESIRITGISIILIAVLLQFVNMDQTLIQQGILKFFQLVISDIIIGVGTGIVSGIIFFKMMKNRFSKNVSPLFLLTVALITYSSAEAMGGNAIFSIMALGFFFGSVSVKGKPFLYEFSSIIAEFSEIFVFLLLGIMISVPFELSLIIKSLILFILFLVIRYLSLLFSFGSGLNTKERFFLALHYPKDVSTGIFLLFIFVEYNLNGMSIIFQTAIIFIIFSVITAYISTISGKKLIKNEVV